MQRDMNRRTVSQRTHSGYGRRPSANRRAKRRQRKRNITTIVSLMAGTALGCLGIVKVYHVTARRMSRPNHQLGSASLKKIRTTSTNAKGRNIPVSSTVTGQTTAPSQANVSSSSKTSATQLPTREAILDKMTKNPLPSSALIHVSGQSQLPQLNNGCEVTSLSMLLSYLKHPVNKMTLAKEEPKDNTPMVVKDKKIVSWGNPNIGFVGSVTGDKEYGFGIYHAPLTKLVDQILPQRGLDLTGSSFRQLEAIVAGGTPVEVWTTYTFQPTNDWTTWKTPEGPIRVTMQEHAVLLVGFNHDDVYINNPGNGDVAQKVPLDPFREAWDQLGKQAITIAPEKYVTS